MNDSQATSISTIVRFKGSRIPSSSEKVAKAEVPYGFFDYITPLNDVILKISKQSFITKEKIKENTSIKGNPSTTTTTQTANLSLLKPTSIKSPYFREFNLNKKIPEKISQNLDPMDLNILCSLDFWIWIESLGYFQSKISSQTDLLSILELQDIGIEKLKKNWITPLELANEDSTANLPLKLENENLLNVDNFIEIAQKGLRLLTNVDFFLNYQLNEDSDTQSESLDFAVKSLNQELYKANINNNLLIRDLRFKTTEKPEFWNKEENSSEHAKLIVRKWGKSNKRKRGFSKKLNLKSSD